MLEAALARLAECGLTVVESSPILESAPVGPSLRRYANAAALIETPLAPLALLDLLKDMERSFGRRTGGQRWTARTLDLDVVLWSGGSFDSPRLTVPHRLFRERAFVLAPARAIAPGWKDPQTGRTVRQLHARLTRSRPLRR